MKLNGLNRVTRHSNDLTVYFSLTSLWYKQKEIEVSTS